MTSKLIVTKDKGLFDENFPLPEFLILDTTRLLIQPQNFPPLPIFQKVYIENLEALSLSFFSSRTRKLFFTWLDGLLLTSPSCIASYVQNASFIDDGQILFKLKLQFKHVVHLESPPKLRPILCSPESFWGPVVGYFHVKEALDKVIRWRFERENQMISMGISSAPIHVILHGSHGNGKTFIASRFKDLGLSFLSLKSSDILSKWFGESEKRLRDIFQKARELSPCILFIDELESLAPSRMNADGGSNGVHSRVLSTFLNEMDGIDTATQQPVIVLACTARIDRVDEALLRPGRIGFKVEVGLPSEDDRKLLLEHFGIRHAPSKWIQQTQGLSVLEIKTLCSKAKFKALRRQTSEVMESDFEFNT